jgi:hypothetical protein
MLVLACWLGGVGAVKPFGYRSFKGEAPGRAISAVRETSIFRHTLTPGSEVGMLTYSWFETGNSAADRYVGDNMVLRYYVDDEPNASIVFTPALGAGSGVGLESAAYYTRNASSGKACGPRPPHTKGPEVCGMDLLDGWPWSTRWMGKGGAASSWISHLRVPFTNNLRITAQVACGTGERACSGVPAEFRRKDISAGQVLSGLSMFRGLEGSEQELGVELGFGALRLPPLKTRRVRLRSQRRTATNVTAGGVVQLASLHEPGTAGAVLMLTVAFDGMRGPLDIEGCWWGVVAENASLVAGTGDGDQSSAFLLGTGVEDIFGNAFGLSWTTKIYHDDNAGLSHVRNGPNPMNHGFPGTSPGASFFSAYRMWDKDPLPFEGKMELAWRNGGPKCSLPGAPDDKAAAGGPTMSLDSVAPNQVHSLVWFYTWDND